MLPHRFVNISIGISIFVLQFIAGLVSIAADNSTENIVDFRYQPPWWQTSICLPDDPEKTLVGKDGSLLYDFGGKFSGFKTRIAVQPSGKTEWKKQALLSPRIPFVITAKQIGAVENNEFAFAEIPVGFDSTVPPPTAAAQNQNLKSQNSYSRRDILISEFINRGKEKTTLKPEILIQSEFPIRWDTKNEGILIGESTKLNCSHPLHLIKSATNQFTYQVDELQLEPDKDAAVILTITRGDLKSETLIREREMKTVLESVNRYWQKVDLPYDHLQVPDAGIQALLDSSIRNIYQAREIKQGLPAFQVGPTCYRGLWVVDGSFIMEAVTYLGRAQEAREGIKYLLSFQRDDGAFMLIDGHWKETGIVLWAVTRHARLTNDMEWLRSVWQKVGKGMNYIREMRHTASANPQAPNAGLIPEGFSDGGLSGKYAEYTNVYWTLAGLRAAVEAARWLGNAAQAEDWQKEYDDFYKTFRKAAERDSKTDAHGNRYLPIRMRDDQNSAPQKAQWAFLHSVFPGKVFAADDPLLQGNMAMLQAVESEGLVYGTGWLSEGIWNYFASFYAHAWLWLGKGQRAGDILYAFANHASPLLCWREEQMPVGKGEQITGDMPHNWASAEFIRLVRHLLVLERGTELHLFEGLPKVWIKPDGVIKVKEIMTEFGSISLELTVAQDGSSALLYVQTPKRNPPTKIVVHREGWSGQIGTLSFDPNQDIRYTIEITK